MDPTSGARSWNSVVSCLRVLHLHFVLFLALFGATEVRSTSTSSRGCPLSRWQALLQAPFYSLSAAMHGSSREAATSQQRQHPAFVQSAGAAASSWVATEGAQFRFPHIIRPRTVDVQPLGMSTVEAATTGKGTKRAAVAPPEVDSKKEEKRARKRAAAKTLGVHVIGLSHHSAGVDVREKLAVPEANWNDASAAVRPVSTLASYLAAVVQQYWVVTV